MAAPITSAGISCSARADRPHSPPARGAGQDDIPQPQGEAEDQKRTDQKVCGTQQGLACYWCFSQKENPRAKICDDFGAGVKTIPWMQSGNQSGQNGEKKKDEWFYDASERRKRRDAFCRFLTYLNIQSTAMLL